MKRKKIAVLLAAAMVTSGVAAPVEGVLASDEIQIESEEGVAAQAVTEESADVQDVTEENTDTPEESMNAVEDSCADNAEFGEVSEDAELSGEDVADISVDADESESEEVEIGEEDLDTDEITADEFTDGETAAVGESAEVIKSGYCGDSSSESEHYKDISYKLYADGRLVIEGNGIVATDGFEHDTRIKSVEMSEGITGFGSVCYWIGDEQGQWERINVDGFNDCVNLTSVTLPESLTSIGEQAFWGCENLSTINIPSGVKRIGEYAFTGCKNLQSINIPSGVPAIEQWTFQGCESLWNINIPSSVTSIGDDAFSNCKSLQSIDIPSGVTEMGASVFSGCENLQSTVIPSGITEIKNSTFDGCKNLSSVNIPSGVVSIGAYAFDGCEKLESISLPENLISLGNAAFRESNLKKIVLPDTTNEIGTYMFAGCQNLRSVRLSKNIQKIGEKMFYNCKRLTDIEIPENVTVIEEEAFMSCSDLTELTLPKGLTEIGNRAFCSTGLLKIALPEGLKRIGDSAFYSAKFTELDLPDSVTEIGENAFGNMSNLEEITVPKNVTELKKDTFDWCWKLKKVSLPEGLLKIDGAFSECSSLETITIPDSVTAIGDATFKSCRSLKELHLSKNLTEIGYEAFAGCEKLENVSLSEKLEYIDTGAFKSCPKLVSVYIPKADVELASRALGYNSDTELNEKLVLIGKAGSTAEKYAAKTGLHFHNVADSLTHHTAVTATCVKDGNVEYWHCDTCDQDFRNAEGTVAVDIITLAKLKHKKTYVPYKYATCTQPGNQSYYHCENCGKNFKYSSENDDTEAGDVTIPATGHNWMWKDESGYYTGSNTVTRGTTRAIHIEKTSNMRQQCWNCMQYGKQKTEKKVLNVNIDQVTLKCGQSTTAFRVSGDPIKSVTSSGGLVKISGLNKKNGTFKVTASSKMIGSTYVRITTTTGLYANVLVKVQNTPVKTTAIRGLAKSVRVVKGKTVTLKPTLEPVISPEKITYSSSNKKIATVSAKGVVKGVKAGTAKITVKSGSKKVVVTVKVTGVKTTKLSGVPTTKKVARGKTFRIKAVATPRNTDEKITYTSSNKKIATVTSAGVVKGLRKGTAIITVRSGSKKMTCKVTVK